LKPRVVLRLVEIQRVLVRHGLVDFVRATHLYRPLRFLFYLSPWTWFQRDSRGARGTRLRVALEELGPVFVKFGQAISTRRDLLPPDIADELVKLQDAVPPFPGQLARTLVEEAQGRPLRESFASFETAPLAAASIAQVHAAKLPDGRDVIVKVLRPDMYEVIARDVEVLYALAGLAERYWTEARRLRPLEVVREYEKTILDELDLLREAANAAQLKRNFALSEQLYVPDVCWDLCRKNVMVMERIFGVPIGDIARLRALGTDFRKLAENGVEIFFTQVFRHNFFHADMHPGNIFVLVDDPANPRYAAVDFGIVGTLDPSDQNYLAENFLAVFNRDYRRVAVLHVESGWVPADARVDEMESAIRTICEPIFDKPLKDISFGVVLLRLFEVLRRFDAVIQPQLILLQKTLFNIEGLGRQLYPELDIWKTASPILREWMEERRHPRAVALRLWQQMPELLTTLELLPLALRRSVAERAAGRRAAPGTTLVEIRAQPAAPAGGAIPGALILLGGIVWLAAQRAPEWPGWAIAALGLVVLIASWRARGAAVRAARR
jgi:ubiquinone biosynthesis protein